VAAEGERNARLREAADVIRALWRGETVEHHGRVTVHAARLYTRPAVPPPLLGAAITEETAEWLGGWADGLITVGADTESLRRIVAAFHRGGGRGKRLILQVALSWAPTDAEALTAAYERWRHAALDVALIADLVMPADFDAATRHVAAEALRGTLRVCADLEQHRRWLERDLELGFDEIHLNHVGADPERFIRAFGDPVLPALPASPL
jgi:coenzyme F420-dependent glucose-6-phosphate dehydrogenase